MKYMRCLVIIMVLVLIEGAFNISPTSCISSSQSAADSPKGDTIVYDYTAQNEDSIVENDNDEETVSDQYHWEPPVIPAFVKRLIPNGDWSADTICVVDGKAYYDITTWYTMLGLMPFSKKIIPIWRRTFP